MDSGTSFRRRSSEDSAPYVWGGVGNNKKTKLYILEQGQTLTAEIYRKVLQENLLPAQKQYPRKWTGRHETMHITMDNDSKHYNDEMRAFLKKNNIQLVGCHRHGVNGQPDRDPGPGGGMQTQKFDDKFPAYRHVYFVINLVNLRPDFAIAPYLLTSCVIRARSECTQFI